MNVLILTQKVDREDAVLGFMHRWIAEFAAHTAQVTVMCLEEGAHTLPKNVQVHSLGKEAGVSRLTYLIRFYRYLFRFRAQYDVVFVHMNHEYVLLGGLLWRLLGKRVCLWYAHGHVPRSLHIATWLAHRVVTSTESGFRIRTAKKRVVGQGIDVDRYACPAREVSDTLRICSIGRLSPIKRYETLIDAGALLKEQGVPFEATILGDAGLPEQQAYAQALRERVSVQGLGDRVHFLGAVPHREIPQYLCAADVFVNTSETGSLDKAGLEAMAAGIPVFVCTAAFDGVLGTHKEQLWFAPGDAAQLATRIRALGNRERTEIGEALQVRVRKEHSVTQLIPKILKAAYE